MFFGSPKAIAMAGAALVVAASQPIAAQSNPFLPSAGASKAEIEAIAEAKVKAMVAEGLIGNGSPTGASPPVAGVAGVPCPPSGPGVPAPGAPVGAPVGGMSGDCIPGGMMPPGAFGEAGLVQPPLGAVEQKLENGARFIGCINGVPKFALKNGTRLSFSKNEISEGVEAGVIPACR